MSRDIKLESIVSAFICFFTALTTPSNLGGCVTDYYVLHITPFHQRITVFQPHVSLPFYFIIYTFFVYIYHFISIDLESSRSCNSLPLQSLQLDLLAKIKIYLVQHIAILILVYGEYKPLIYKTNTYKGRKEDE